jgi:hypothetical protein
MVYDFADVNMEISVNSMHRSGSSLFPTLARPAEDGGTSL